MRATITLVALIAAALMAAALMAAAGLLTSAAAQQPDPAPGVVGCETLVALRVLMAAAPDSRAAASRLTAHPACRPIAKARIGAVEHRAMIGGAPFECMAIEGETACAWILP